MPRAEGVSRTQPDMDGGVLGVVYSVWGCVCRFCWFLPLVVR